MNGFFITGTDTGIGKTVLTALVLAELRRRGVRAAPMKPVQTGCERRPDARLAAPDLDYSLSMAGMDVAEADYRRMAPFCFEPACSPHLAAERAGIEIRMETLVGAAHALAAEYECLLIEGAGGVLVPLNRRETMLDLMKVLGLPVLIAARAGLGTINHTLLSVRALRTAGIAIAGVVLLEGRDSAPGAIEADNPAAIAQFGGIPVLGTVPYGPALREPRPVYSALPDPVVAEIGKIVDKLMP